MRALHTSPVSRWRVFAAGLALVAALAAPALAAQSVLYEKPSAYNTIVVTEDEAGVRTLRFEKNGARQSVVKYGDPDYLGLAYTQAAFVGLALTGEPRRVLVIGLGGGTLPVFLHKYYPQAAIDAVDIDPDVVDVAKKFFGFREDDRMRAHVADGRRFIENTSDPYDLIFLDAFGLDSVPPQLTTEEFLQSVRRAIRPGGVVIGNLWGRRSNPLYDSMVRTYNTVFDELFVLNVRGAENKIVLALPRKQPLTRDELTELARNVSAAKGFRFDLGEIASNGLLPPQERYEGGRVLRDRDVVPAR